MLNDESDNEETGNEYRRKSGNRFRQRFLLFFFFQLLGLVGQNCCPWIIKYEIAQCTMWNILFQRVWVNKCVMI